MAANVQFNLDADEQKAVQAFLNVVNAQDKSTRGFKKTTQAGKKNSRQLQDVGRKATQLVGTLAGGAGVAGAAFAVARGFDEMGRRAVAFDDAITPLLSLGDNINNIQAIREEVLGLSSGFGIARDQIADTLFSLQSGTANLSEQIQGDLLESGLKLTQLAGGDLNTNMTALIKTFQIFGQDAAGVDDVLNLSASPKTRPH